MILACDPGLQGAFALTNGAQLFWRDMPLRKTIVNRRERKVVDELGLEALLHRCRPIAEILLIEDVNGMPGQSGPAAFNFGYGVGLICGMAHCLNYRVEKVHPSHWKAVMKCPADKSLARQRASEVWPEHAGAWTLKKHDGRAEAALIAKYGWDVYGRQ